MTTVLTPRDGADLQALVADAMTRGRALKLGGSFSRDGYGNISDGDAVSLAAFSGIRAYEPAELVMTLGAATPLREVKAALAQAGQHLAFEIPDWGPLWGGPAGQGTIGGLILTGMAGSRRISAGGARDHFLGFTAVNGRGQLYKAGGQVVKNVTGYDLPKLMAGSFGTLSALTELTVKTLPKPETVATLLVAADDAQTGLAAMTAAMGSPHEVSGAAWVPPSLAAYFVLPAAGALIRLEGFEGSVAARAEALSRDLARLGRILLLPQSVSQPLWQNLSDAAPFAARPDWVLWRLSVTPSEGPAVLAQLGNALGNRSLGWLDWAGGLVWAALPPDMPDAGAELVRGVVAGRGHATLIRAPEEIRCRIPVFEPHPALAPLLAAVKASFDPAGIFTPGRMG